MVRAGEEAFLFDDFKDLGKIAIRCEFVDLYLDGIVEDYLYGY